MTEEPGEKEICPPNERTLENGWIVVRSQKRLGMFYDFNTRTGEAYWRDDFGPSSEKVIDQHQNQFDFQEPIEPPPLPTTSQKRKAVSPISYQYSKQTRIEPAVNSLPHGNHMPHDIHMSSGNQSCCCGKCHNSGMNNVVPKIYNNQIINNQLSGQYTMSAPIVPIPFVNSNSTDFGPIVPPGYPFAVPPPRYGEPMYLPNLNPHNTTVPLNIIHETPMMHPNGPVGFQANSIPRHAKKFVKNKPKMTTDLRGLLNRKNRQALQSDVHEFEQPKTNDKIDKPKEASALITEGELNPDDNDPWLETFADIETNKLRIDMDYIWDIATDSASRDCWYIVPTQRVLINNIRFLSIIINSDERARLLVSQDAVRALRSVTFSNNSRVADYAKRAMILIRQTSKYSNSLQATDVKSCLKFIEQGKHVILLVDEKDTHYQEMRKVAPVLTVSELKNSLTLSWEEKNPGIMRKIKITFSNIRDKPESLTEVNTIPSPSPLPEKASEYDTPEAGEDTPEAGEYDTPEAGEYDTPETGEYGTPTSNEYETVNAGEYDTQKANQYVSSKASEYNILEASEYFIPKLSEVSQNDTRKVNQCDTSIASQYDTPKDSQYDTAKDSQYDTAKDSQYDTAKDSQYDTAKDSQYDTAKDSQYDTAKASQYDTAKDSQYDTAKASQYDTAKDSQYDTAKDSQYDTAKDSQYDTAKDSQYDTAKASHYDIPKASQYDTLKAPVHSSNPFEIKNVVIQIPTTSKKNTVNASVQTDLIMVPPPEESTKETTSQPSNADSLSNDNSTIKVPPRKIRLKRQNQPSNVCDASEKKHFKWRKRKDNGSTSTPSQIENGSITSSLSTSTADLLAQQNDNAVDFGVGGVNIDPKMVEETSTSGVISNSLDSDRAFRISKESYMNESILNQIEEVAYEITSDFMKEHLSTRIDEWVALFNQIMEEVLSEVLRLNPPFVDPNMPGPWTVMEATLCVERKFYNHRIIAASCKKLSNFLDDKSDQKGSINSKDISPEDFMKMYNCGVQLINVLQMNLQQNEDLKLASTQLSQLLSDIQDNNSDEASLLLDTFQNDDNSPNISDNVSTNMSSTDVVDNSQSVPASQGSSHQKDKNAVCNNPSPRYGLRSSRVQIEKVVENETESEKKNTKHSLFSSLGLKQNNSIPLTSFVRTISNDQRDQKTLTAPTEKTRNEADTKQNDVKVFRNFIVCPEIEKKLKGSSVPTDQYDYESEGDNYNSEVDQTANDEITDDFTEDVDFIEPERVINIHKFFVRITSEIQLCMVNSRRFCEDTYENVKNIHKWRSEYKMEVEEKIEKVNKTLLTVCYRLKDILDRDPSLTECKFSGILKAFKAPDSSLKELKQHLDNYRIKIEIYLEHSYFLLQFVKLLGDAVKNK